MSENKKDAAKRETLALYEEWRDDWRGVHRALCDMMHRWRKITSPLCEVYHKGGNNWEDTDADCQPGCPIGADECEYSCWQNLYRGLEGLIAISTFLVSSVDEQQKLIRDSIGKK